MWENRGSPFKTSCLRAAITSDAGAGEWSISPLRLKLEKHAVMELFNHPSKDYTVKSVVPGGSPQAGQRNAGPPADKTVVTQGPPGLGVSGHAETRLCRHGIEVCS